nr:MAG TPA: hypothetical protein [Caudoviricetes sp.]
MHIILSNHKQLLWIAKFGHLNRYVNVRSSLEADLHPIQIVRSVPIAESGASEVASFLINGVDHHKNDCIPVIVGFVLCGEKINLNMSMG